MAAGLRLFAAAACLAMSVMMVRSYPSGAPEEACASLLPTSHGPSTATGPSPYVIKLSSTTYTANQVITATLGGAAFKGFLVVGRKEGSTEQVGTFQNPADGQKLVCASNPGSNGITHSNKTVKATSVLQWKAPSQSVGTVRFHYTVVRGGAPNTSPESSDYYTGLVSDAISPAGFTEHEEKREHVSRREKKKEHLVFEEIIYRSKPFA